MCGIFGFTSWNGQTDRLFPIIADEMESRGSTSWGTSNGITFLKRLGPITKTIDHSWRGWDCTKGLIFHTRAPSAGTGRAVDDAHPFMYRRPLTIGNTPEYTLHRGVIGLHNGYVASQHTLKTKYPDRKDFSVDSMHIFKHICDDDDISEITGSGAIAWFETVFKEYVDTNKPVEVLERRLYLARFDTEALYLGVLDTGEIVFASTKDAIEKSARLACTNVVKYLDTKARTKYELITGEPAELKEIGPMPFGTTANCYTGGVVNGHYQAPGESRGSFTGGQSSNRGMYLGKNERKDLEPDADFFLCPGCDTKIDPLKCAICDDCLEVWLDSINDRYKQ